MQSSYSWCWHFRLSTVVNCDQILVLDRGRVAEQGSHAELVADRASLYYKLWSSQQHQDQ